MRCATSRSLFACSLILAVALSAIPLVAAASNVCPKILPADVVAVSEPRLCRSGDPNGDKFSVCREYQNNQRIYQVVYRGGTEPKAVYARVRPDGHRDNAENLAARHDIADRICRLSAPPSVPAGATYSGTGVCEDEQGRPLPCSLYEHAAARQPEALRYFVYYEPDGSGIRRIDAVSAGQNEHMLEAELAFQLGQSLVNDICCREQAQAYLAHAAALFPDDGVYRAALVAQQGERATSHHDLTAAYSRILEHTK